MRINRFLSMSGVSSRRKGEELIRAGRVTVNGKKVTDPAHAVEPGADMVCLDGRSLDAHSERRWILFNKPAGVIVSVGDPFGRPTVMDLLESDGRGLFPVGRLDADTSGVLLLTDDGDLAHKLTHPSFGVQKVYRAHVSGSLTDEGIRSIEAGIVLDDGPAAPARVKVISRGRGLSYVEMTLHQGRKRQVRRMLEQIGNPVLDLDRVSFGGVTAKGVPEGSYRPLNAREIGLLKRAVRSGRDQEKTEKN